MKFNFLSLINLVLVILSLNLTGFSQTNSNIGCQTIDNSKPLLFLSYEKFIDSKKKADREIQLRLINNSNCTIVFSVPQSSLKSDEIADGQIVSAGYELQIVVEGKIGVMFGGGGDAFSSAYLKGGRSTLFNVPLRYFKQTSDLRLAFQYDWERNKNTIIERTSRQTVYNYLVFSAGYLPKDVYKKL